MFECPWDPSLEQQRVDARVGDTTPNSETCVERGTKIAHFIQVFPYPGRTEGSVVRRHICRRLFCLILGGVNCIISSIGGEHATLHGIVGAFYLGDIHEACGAANKGATGEV